MIGLVESEGAPEGALSIQLHGAALLACDAATPAALSSRNSPEGFGVANDMCGVLLLPQAMYGTDGHILVRVKPKDPLFDDAELEVDLPPLNGPLHALAKAAAKPGAQLPLVLWLDPTPLENRPEGRTEGRQVPATVSFDGQDVQTYVWCRKPRKLDNVIPVHAADKAGRGWMSERLGIDLQYVTAVAASIGHARDKSGSSGYGIKRRVVRPIPPKCTDGGCNGAWRFEPKEGLHDGIADWTAIVMPHTIS